MSKKINFEQESGRSMVEMLGVLAIIGVLSVGGISGYTTAMNKHKANEILNAAAVRAMAVSTQLQNGTETPSLGEFTGTSSVGGATFDDEGTITSSGGKFTIGFTNNGKPSEAVLKQMEQIAGTDGIVRKITDGGLIYNDDLSTEVRASDFDNDSTNCVEPKYHLCSGSGRCLDVGTDCNTSCSGPAPVCKSVCDATGSWVVDAENDVGKACKVSASSTENDGVCSASGVCVEQIAGKKCTFTSNTNNIQCGGIDSDYYCDMEGKVDYDGTEGSCYTFGDGTCQAVSGLKGSGNYTNTEVNWYTGYSFCQGLGKDMVTGRGNSKVSCTGDFQWDGNNYNYGSCTTSLSAPDHYWLDTCTDDATKSCATGSCNAFLVNLYGYVDSVNSRNDCIGYALCE